MAEPVVVHANSPEQIHFPCPSCGRDCLLTPLFHTKGSAEGVRHGHGVQHIEPVCRTYRTMSRLDFLKLATWEVPSLRDDPHVSVKEPAPAPLIMLDGGAKAKTQAERDGLELERHRREVAAFEAEARELAHVRDNLRQLDERDIKISKWRTVRQVSAGAAVAVLVLMVLAGVVLAVLRAR